MTETELKAIEERWAKATPGPWSVEDGEIVKPVNAGERLFLVVGNEVDEDGFTGDFVLEPDNATAIASAPTDIATLLAEVRRLNVENQKLRNCDNCKKPCMKKPANTELDVLERMDYCKSHGRSAWKAR